MEQSVEQSVEPSVKRAVVADEAALLRSGVGAVLESCGLEVVGETHSGRAAVRLAAADDAQLLVLGVTTDLDPADVIRRTKRLRPPPAVVALLRGREDAPALVSLGVDALLMRTVRTDDLTDAVLRVFKGERVVAPALLPALVGEVRPTPRVGPAGGSDVVLTSREREILAFLAEGLANREIAAEIFVTLATVKTHVAHIYAKLGARNRNDALGRAVALGLLG
ncbi:MAG: response regulator transcription factor [Acidimicrobiia bacterium]|nr:response regulator transcription factor [Acidimicrobiia bacterium]